MTSEEVTAKRRADRKQFKADRAQAIAAAAAEAELAFQEGRDLPSSLNFDGKRCIPSASTWKSPMVNGVDNPGISPEIDDETIPVDLEFLQLTLEEAFFLKWSLGCLNVLDPRTVRCLP